MEEGPNQNAAKGNADETLKILRSEYGFFTTVRCFFPNFEEVWGFRGYRLTRHPRTVVIFLLSYTSMLCEV